MLIIGAGLSGLIAAHAFPQASIIERNAPRQNHKALLRFRSEAVAHITNIPFQKVTVRKGIYDTNTHQLVPPNISLANQYSEKVVYDYADRSIWHTETAERFVAPENFYELLLNAVGNRVEWEIDYAPEKHNVNFPIISTIPLGAYSVMLGVDAEFRRKPIKVHRFRITGADVYQTIYFPRRHYRIFRASITKDLLIVESKPTQGIPELMEHEMRDIADAFGIDLSRIADYDSEDQEFGKIAPVPEPLRRSMVRRLTTEYGIYSLGRFATWRNILLDDVVHDIDVIKQLIKADDYDARLISK